MPRGRRGRRGRGRGGGRNERRSVQHLVELPTAAEVAQQNSSGITVTNVSSVELTGTTKSSTTTMEFQESVEMSPATTTELSESTLRQATTTELSESTLRQATTTELSESTLRQAITTTELSESTLRQATVTDNTGSPVAIIMEQPNSPEKNDNTESPYPTNSDQHTTPGCADSISGTGDVNMNQTNMQEYSETSVGPRLSINSDTDSPVTMGSKDGKDSYGDAVNALFTLAGEAGNVTETVECTNDDIAATTTMEDSDNNSIASQEPTATASTLNLFRTVGKVNEDNASNARNSTVPLEFPISTSAFVSKWPVGMVSLFIHVKWSSNLCSIVTAQVNYRCAASSRVAQVPLNCIHLRGSYALMILSTVVSADQCNREYSDGVNIFNYDEIHNDVQFSFNMEDIRQGINPFIQFLNSKIQQDSDDKEFFNNIFNNLTTPTSVCVVINKFMRLYNGFMLQSSFEVLYSDLYQWNATNVSLSCQHVDSATFGAAVMDINISKLISFPSFIVHTHSQSSLHRILDL